MASSKDLALNALKNLAALSEVREMCAKVFGDERDCHYPGDIEEDLKKLATQVLKEHKDNV